MRGMMIATVYRHPKKITCDKIFRVKKYFHGNKHFISKFDYECKAKDSKVSEVMYSKWCRRDRNLTFWSLWTCVYSACSEVPTKLALCKITVFFI